jgi:hypothetical protein
MRLAVALALSLAASQTAHADGPVTGVIELFTSQGCSSCPPADALMEVLAQRPDLAVLSLPVDYWDRLGWKDTYGSPAHSARQRAYATTRNDRSVYTPQVVVNGTHHMNGADRSEIESNLELLRSRLSVAVDITQANGVLRIAIGPTPTAAASSVRSATVVIMPYLARREVAIGRGENARRKIAYTNIVRNIQDAGQWTGEARTFEIPLAALNGADGAVVVLQTGNLEKPGPLIGAAQIAVAAAP